MTRWQILATLIRAVVSFFATAAIATWRQKWSWPRGAKLRAAAFLPRSVLATWLSWLFYYHTLQSRVAATDKPLSVVFVIFVTVLALAFLGEPLTPRLAGGGALVAAGVLVRAWPAAARK